MNSITTHIISRSCAPQTTIAAAATCCTRQHAVQMPQSDAHNLIQRVVGYGHTSILEHASITIAITGLSRACANQLVRHRMLSYCQQSMRHVKIDPTGGTWYVVPPHITSATASCHYHTSMDASAQAYIHAINNGMDPQDARYLLPLATRTNIIVSGNLRAWQQMLQQRLCLHAQWEIRHVAKQIAKEITTATDNLITIAPPCGTKGECHNCPGKNKG